MTASVLEFERIFAESYAKLHFVTILTLRHITKIISSSFRII